MASIPEGFRLLEEPIARTGLPDGFRLETEPPSVKQQPETPGLLGTFGRGFREELTMGYGASDEAPDLPDLSHKIAYGAGSLAGMLPSFAALSVLTGPVTSTALKVKSAARVLGMLNKIGKPLKIINKAGKVTEVSRLGMATEQAIKSGALFATHGALHKPAKGEEGLAGRAERGLKSAPMGMAFGGSAALPIGRLGHVGVAGGIGAGMTAIEGGSTEDILIQGGLLSAMSALHIGISDARKIVKQVANEIDSLPKDQQAEKVKEVLGNANDNMVGAIEDHARAMSLDDLIQYRDHPRVAPYADIIDRVIAEKQTRTEQPATIAKEAPEVVGEAPELPKGWRFEEAAEARQKYGMREPTYEEPKPEPIKPEDWEKTIEEVQAGKREVPTREEAGLPPEARPEVPEKIVSTNFDVPQNLISSLENIVKGRLEPRGGWHILELKDGSELAFVVRGNRLSLEGHQEGGEYGVGTIGSTMPKGKTIKTIRAALKEFREAKPHEKEEGKGLREVEEAELLYHGTNKEGAEAIRKNGILGGHSESTFLTPNLKAAQEHARAKGGTVFAVRKSDLKPEWIEDIETGPVAIPPKQVDPDAKIPIAKEIPIEVHPTPKAKEPWEMTREEFAANQGKDSAYVQQQRDAIVKQALKQGKPIPPEVLKDYPELAEKGKVQPEIKMGDKVEYKGETWEVGFVNKLKFKGTLRLQKSGRADAEQVNYVDPKDVKLVEPKKKYELPKFKPTYAIPKEDFFANRPAGERDQYIQAKVREHGISTKPTSQRGKLRYQEAARKAADEFDRKREEEYQKYLDSFKRTEEPAKPEPLSGAQAAFIAKRVEALGSVEAVNKAYPGDSLVDEYARRLAEASFGEVAEPIGRRAWAGESVKDITTELKQRYVAEARKEGGAWDVQASSDYFDSALKPLIKKLHGRWDSMANLPFGSTRGISNLKKLDALDIIWDREGNSYYALKGTPKPKTDRFVWGKEADELFKEKPKPKEKPTLKERAAQKETKKQADKLRKVAERTKKQAEEKYSADRLTNTVRRARMAAGAQESAAQDIAIAETMLKIADAIEAGEVEHLKAVSAKTHVQLLDKELTNAQYKSHRKKYLDYAEQQEHKGDPITDEDIKFAEYPTVRLHESMVASTAKELSKHLGGKKLANRLRGQFIDYDLASDILKLARKKGFVKDLPWTIASDVKDINAMKRMGIENVDDLKAALRELRDVRSEKRKEDPIQKLERELVGLKITGFFPTPRPVIEEMLEKAAIEEGMSILEPSAGKGDIIDAIRKELQPSEHLIHAVEMNVTLQRLLDAKGVKNLHRGDFLQLDESRIGEYDRILMNPPFEKGQDIDHVRHAYDLLKPGGRLVSIMSEGPFFRNDKKATAFREWLDELGGESEKLEPNAFKGIEAFRETGAAARVVTIDKAGEAKPKAPELSLAKTFEENPSNLANATNKYLKENLDPDTPQRLDEGVGSYKYKNVYKLKDGKYYYFGGITKAKAGREQQRLIQLKNPSLIEPLKEFTGPIKGGSVSGIRKTEEKPSVSDQIDQFERDLERKGFAVAPDDTSYKVITFGPEDKPAIERVRDGVGDTILGFNQDEFTSLEQAKAWAISEAKRPISDELLAEAEAKAESAAQVAERHRREEDQRIEAEGRKKREAKKVEEVEPPPDKVVRIEVGKGLTHLEILKAQKEKLLEEIDAVITRLLADHGFPEDFERPLLENIKWEREANEPYFVKFILAEDQEFRIINQPKALEEFKKNVKRTFPTRIPKLGPYKSEKQRSFEHEKKTFAKILAGKKYEIGTLEPKDIPRLLSAVEPELRDHPNAYVNYNGFINWLLSQDLKPGIRQAIYNISKDKAGWCCALFSDPAGAYKKDTSNVFRDLLDVIEKAETREIKATKPTPEQKKGERNLKEDFQAIGRGLQGLGIKRGLEHIFASPEWYEHPKQAEATQIAIDRSSWFHENFNDFNKTWDPFTPFDTVSNAMVALGRKGGISKLAFLMGKRSKEYKQLEDILDDADIMNKVYREKDLERKGLDKDVIHVWRLIRDCYDRQLEAMQKPMKDLIAEIEDRAKMQGKEPVYPDFGEYIDKEGKRRSVNLKEALMMMGQFKGSYAPRIRQAGNWVVQGKKGIDDYVREHRRSKIAAELLANKLRREGYTDVHVGPKEQILEETFQLLQVMEVNAAIEHAIKSGEAIGKYDVDIRMALEKDLLTAAADLIKSRGARSTMIRRRRGGVVRGYMTDPVERTIRYTSNNAAGMAKAKAAREMFRVLFGEVKNGKLVGGVDQAKEPQVHRALRKYIEEQLRNPDKADRAIGLAKSLATFKYLGFNPRSILVNVTSLATTAPVALHQYVLNGKGSMTRVLGVLSKASKDYIKVMKGQELSDLAERRFIEEVRTKGYTDPQYMREAIGHVQGAYGTAWSKAIGGSMWAFGKSEEWVRGGTALAGFRLARKAGLSEIEATRVAKIASDRAHGIYGKATFPAIAQGTGIAARTAQLMYVYAKFPHNALQMYYDVGIKKGNIKGLIYALAAPAVLSGAAAFPMKDTIIAFVNTMLKAIGIDRDAEKFVHDTIREQFGESVEKRVRGGILGEMGIDISGSLAMGPGSIPHELVDLTGAIGGVGQDIAHAWRFVKTGQPGRAVESVLPSMASNILRAHREIEGATTRHGYRIWDEEGRPYVPTKSETALRTAGFRSARAAQLAEKTWQAKRERSRFDDRRRFIYEKYRAYLMNPTPKLRQEVWDDIYAFNKSALATGGITPITKRSIKDQVRRMARPSMKERRLLAQ